MTTNREQLNQISNEELAEFLNKDVCLYCVFSSPINSCAPYSCIEGVLKWLNQESEE